jgi:hypothetical protein
MKTRLLNLWEQGQPSCSRPLLGAEGVGVGGEIGLQLPSRKSAPSWPFYSLAWVQLGSLSVSRPGPEGTWGMPVGLNLQKHFPHGSCESPTAEHYWLEWIFKSRFPVDLVPHCRSSSSERQGCESPVGAQWPDSPLSKSVVGPPVQNGWVPFCLGNCFYNRSGV